MMLGHMFAVRVVGALLVIMVMAMLSMYLDAYLGSDTAVVGAAFLGEGRKAFGGVLGKCGRGGADLLHRPIGGAGVDRLLGHLYRNRGTVGDLVGHGVGGVNHLRPGRQLVGDTPAKCPLSAQRLAGEDQLLGSSGADKIAKPSGATPSRQGANADLRQTKCRVVSNNP